MIDFATKEVLTFDCYGTLIDWEAGILSTLQPILNDHRVTVDPEYLCWRGILLLPIESCPVLRQNSAPRASC